MDARVAAERLGELGFRVIRVLKSSNNRVTLLCSGGPGRVVVKVGWGAWRSLVENEARVLRLLGGSPIAPRLYARLDLGDAVAVVEEAIGYRSLDALQKPLPVASIVSVLFHTLASLAQLHGLGVAHCDLKPANLIPVPRRGIVVVDFDLARRFDTRGPSAGTPGYTCPEALSGGPPGPGCDLYSIPAIYYNLSTGRQPPPDPAGLANALRSAPGPSALIELLAGLALNPDYRDALDPLALAKMIARHNPRLLTPHVIVDDRYHPVSPAGLRVGDPPVLEVRPRRPHGAEIRAYTDAVIHRRGRRIRLQPGDATELEYGDIVVTRGHIIRAFIP